PPSISPVLPFVLSVKPLLTSDNNFTDIEPSLPLEPSFENEVVPKYLSHQGWIFFDTMRQGGDEYTVGVRRTCQWQDIRAHRNNNSSQNTANSEELVDGNVD
ncbi:17738_t:CDS:2, partial [Rhizophagus irregularis]